LPPGSTISTSELSGSQTCATHRPRSTCTGASETVPDAGGLEAAEHPADVVDHERHGVLAVAAQRRPHLRTDPRRAHLEQLDEVGVGVERRVARRLDAAHPVLPADQPEDRVEVCRLVIGVGPGELRTDQASRST
jgi:hypothetical protein